MSNVVLSDKLVKCYLDFCNGQITESKLIEKLLMAIQPFLVSKSFLESNGINQQMQGQISHRYPLIKIVSSDDIDELISQSKLKLLLVDDNARYTFSSYNILNSKHRGFHYAISLSAGDDRTELTNYLKELLKQASEVTIVDRYFAVTRTQFDRNKSCFQKIIPASAVTILQYDHSENRDDIDVKSELHVLLYNVRNHESIGNQVHDRYIKTSILKISLSSGFEYLTNSSKELLVLVEILTPTLRM